MLTKKRVFGAILLSGIVFSASCGSSSPSSEYADPDAGVDDGSGGDVSCTSTQRTCNGVCVDVLKDIQNCGDCGRACDTGAQCCGGVCVATAACTFGPTKVDTYRLYLSGGQWVTIHGAGFAAGMKVHVGDGRAPVRVQDPTTALLLTPPGSSGVVDLTIDLNGQTATLKNAFEYVEAGLETPWQQKPMGVVRGEFPGIAVLQDGRVLIAGGTEVPDNPGDVLPDGGANRALESAEIYTRSTDVVTSVTAKMNAPRWRDAAVTLMTGKVLVVGAACEQSPCPEAKIADLFDPTTNTFTSTKSPLNHERREPRAALLPDGRVLIASSRDATLEIYDPEKDAFSLVSHTIEHTYGFMMRLRDGRVLFGGGDGGITAVEVFDPDTDQITSVGPLAQGRSMLTAHALPDGRALVIGGSSINAGAIHVPLDTIEIFDPKANTFSTAPYKLASGRTWHASALVRDGSVLVMGGYTIDNQCSSLSATVDQILPVAGKVIPFATLPNPNTEWTAVTLLDGSVLGVGGGACGTTTALPDLDFLPGAPETK